jgi:Uri superfamily endonuclease
MKGAYLLIVELPADTNILVGKQGMIPFEKGSYGYVGSALNGLEQRIKRHLRSRKKLHWHIDYLLAYAEIKNVFIKESATREECELAQAFEQVLPAVPGFGCSDCACQSHLFAGPVDTMMQTATSLQMKPYPGDANP